MKMLHATFLLITSIAFANAQSSHIVSISSGLAPAKKCLRVPHMMAGAPVQIYDCDDSPGEKWKIGYHLGSRPTRLQIVDSNLCLEAVNLHPTTSNVVISKCNRGPLQEWDYTGNDSRLRLVANPGLCLDLPDSNTDNGNKVQTYSCNDGDNQVWLLVAQ